MSAHTHADDRLTVGCPECIRTTRLAEEIARWEQAPLRLVTWHCSYWTATTGIQTTTFTLKLKVPDGASTGEIDQRYIDQTGEAFTTAAQKGTAWPTAPPGMSSALLADACASFEVEKIVVGEPIVLEPVGAPQPGLFG